MVVEILKLIICILKYLLLKKILKLLKKGRLYIKLLRMVVQKLGIPEYYITHYLVPEMQRIIHIAGVFIYTLHVLHKVIYTLKLKLSIVLVIRIEYNLVVNIIAMLPKVCIVPCSCQIRNTDHIHSVTLHALYIVRVSLKQIIVFIALLELFLEDHYCILLLLFCNGAFDNILYVITIIHSAGIRASAALSRYKLRIKVFIRSIARAIPKRLKYLKNFSAYIAPVVLHCCNLWVKIRSLIQIVKACDLKILWYLVSKNLCCRTQSCCYIVICT